MTLRPVVGAFVVFGAFAGAWAIAVLDVQHTFGLSDAQLGGILAAGIVLAAGVNAVGGALTDRWGPSAALTRSLVVWSLLLLGVAAAPVVGVFAVAFTLTMAAGGFVDVVMNVVAAAALSGRPGHLVRFHGLFNLGALLGAAASGLVLELDGSWRVVWVGIAVTALALAVVTRRSTLPRAASVEHPSLLRALAGLRHEGLVVLAIVFAASAMVEGGIATWGVLYLRGHLHTGVVVGVAAYVIGQGLATVMRIGAGPAVGALGIRRGVAFGGGLAAIGLALEALADTAAIGVTGLALACMGIAVVWPLLLAEVNNEARHPALAIGGVTAAGYLGMVAGPPIVGVLSGVLGLATGIMFLAAAAAFVAITPAHVRRGAGAAQLPARN